MFIWSCKASSIKRVGFLLAFVLVLTLTVCLLPVKGEQVVHTAYTGVDVTFDKIKDNDARIGFLSQFGWQAEKEAHDTAQVTIPKEFDKIFSAYNNIQLSQGLDLEPYKNKTVTRYTYKITNYPNYEGTVYANLFLYRDRVIGADICSADVNGFLHGLQFPKSESPQ